MPDAVVLDLDGVLIDSEERWDAVRQAVAAEHGGRWTPQATRAMMGMSAPEWARYMHEQLGVTLAPASIQSAVVGRLEQDYREHLPLLPGAVEAVRALAAIWPLGLASSSNRTVIELVLDRSRLRDAFAAVVSSEEVAAGKPAPDVYIQAARRLGVAAVRCVAVEDSASGLRSAAAAAMKVVAVPNHAFPADPDALALADAVVDGIRWVTPELIERVSVRSGRAG